MADTPNTKIILSLDQQKTAAQINADIKKLQNKLNKVITTGALDSAATVKQINRQIKELEKQLKTYTLEADKSTTAKQSVKKADSKKESAADNTIVTNETHNSAKNSKIEKPRYKQTQVSKEAITENETYASSLNKINTQIDKMQFNTLTEGFNQTYSSIEQTGEIGSSLKQIFSDASQSLLSFFSTGSAVDLLITKTKDALSELKKTDEMLTKISKTNRSLSKSELEKIGNEAYKTADKYGISSNDYLSEVYQASLSGYKNPEEIAELSISLQSVGGITSELANSYINATDKAYKLDGSSEKLKETLDGIFNITKNSTVSLDKLAEGMSLSSSKAASLGISASETAAALSTIMTYSHEGGSETANAFNSILSGLEQIKNKESEISSEGISNYEKACNALNVSLTETKNGITSLKDPMQIIKELSAEYVNLGENDIRKENFLNAIDDETSVDAIDSLFSNYDTYEKMLNDYADGTYSVTQAAQQSVNTWEGSLNRLSNTWSDTIGNVADSGSITTIINALNSLLTVVDKITEKFSSAELIGLGAGLLSGFKNTGKRRISVRIS